MIHCKCKKYLCEGFDRMQNLSSLNQSCNTGQVHRQELGQMRVLLWHQYKPESFLFCHEESADHRSQNKSTMSFKKKNGMQTHNFLFAGFDCTVRTRSHLHSQLKYRTVVVVSLPPPPPPPRT
jgi:hypothetical protein